jgi:hypothetical protein
MRKLVYMVLFSKTGNSIVSCCLHMLDLLFRFVGCFEIIDSEKQQQPVAGLWHDRGSSRMGARARPTGEGRARRSHRHPGFDQSRHGPEASRAGRRGCLLFYRRLRSRASRNLPDTSAQNSPLFELARVLVRLRHVARCIVSANHSAM